MKNKPRHGEVASDEYDKLIQEVKKEFQLSFGKLSDELKKLREDFSSEFRELNNSITTLRREAQEKDLVIENLTNQVNHLDQYGRNKHFELSNVEETDGEIVEAIILKVADKLNITLREQDIEAAHRIPTRVGSRPARIIVQLASRRLRDEFIANRRKVITNQQITGSLNKHQIYINENLCPYYRELLWKAKTQAKEANYKFVWFKNSKILARKDENSRQVLYINSFSDIDKIK